jgi:hypothetical protein
MNTRVAIQRLVMIVAVGMMGGCTTVGSMPASDNTPFFIAEASEKKLLQELAQRQDRLLRTCAKRLACEQLLYARGLTALFESRSQAATRFEQVATSAPKSPYAVQSTQWLGVLSGAPPSDATRALFGRYVARHLLDQDAPPRAVRAAAEDKRVEELTRQLEMLKQIEQERPVRERPLPRMQAPDSAE